MRDDPEVVLGCSGKGVPDEHTAQDSEGHERSGATEGTGERPTTAALKARPVP